MGLSITIRTNNIGQLQGDVVDRTESAVRDSAHDMRDYAQQIAPVETGAFRASLYVNGPNGESDYIQAAARASELRPDTHIILEQFAAVLDLGIQQLRNPMTGRFSLPEAIMGSAVEYSLYLEEGTVHMAPRPTFRQAALHTEGNFLQRMMAIANGY